MPSTMERILILATAAIAMASMAQAQTFPASRSSWWCRSRPAGRPTPRRGWWRRGCSLGIGQSVIIENQGGAGGTIAAKQVATAAPDGYTLMMVAAAHTFGTHPLLYKLDFDPMKAFAPVAIGGGRPAGDGGRPGAAGEDGAGARRLCQGQSRQAQLRQRHRHRPAFHLEMFKLKAGTDIVHVPYRGSAPMIADLIAGQMQMTHERQVGAAAAHPGRQGARARGDQRERWAGLAGRAELLRGRLSRLALRHAVRRRGAAGTPAAIIASSTPRSTMD